MSWLSIVYIYSRRGGRKPMLCMWRQLISYLDTVLTWMFIGCNVPDEQPKVRVPSQSQCHCPQPSPPTWKVSADEVKADGRAVLIFLLAPAAVNPSGSGGLCKLRSLWWVWLVDFLRCLTISPLKSLVLGVVGHPSICHQDWGFELALQISTRRADVHGLVDVEVTWGGPETKIIGPRGRRRWCRAASWKLKSMDHGGEPGKYGSSNSKYERCILEGSFFASHCSVWNVVPDSFISCPLDGEVAFNMLCIPLPVEYWTLTCFRQNSRTQKMVIH